jgi:hypothetical protein
VNGASISGSTLNLEPASASFGGIVNTTTQTFAGAKTFNADILTNGVRVGRGVAGITSNTVLGRNALGGTSVTSNENSFNTAIGISAMQNADGTGSYNTAVGANSAFFNNSGSHNTYLGYQSGYYTTSGAKNVAIGSWALYGSTTGNYLSGAGNNAIGFEAMKDISTTAADNIAIGLSAGTKLTTGTKNVFIGSLAGSSISTGSSSNTTGLNSVLIGYDVRPNGNAETNQIVISGYNGSTGTVGNGSNTTTIGNSSTIQTYLPSGLTMGNSLGSTDATLTLNPNSTLAQGGAEGGQLNFKKSVSTSSTYDWFIDQYADANGARLRFLPGRTNPESYGMAISEEGYIGMGSIPTSSYRLNVSGTVGATGYVTTSDLRLKTNISSLSSAMNTLNLLIPVSYDKKVSLTDSVYSKQEFGFIAQEVQKVLPQLVTEGKDKDHLLSLDYISIIPLLTKAMQEQDVVIKNTQLENKQLKAQLEEQNRRLEEIEKLVQQLIKSNN